MGIFHNDDEDKAFAAGHAEDGRIGANLRINALRDLLRQCAPHLPANSTLSAEVAAEMLKPDEWYVR